MAVFFTFGSFAQSLSLNDNEIELSKEAKKASTKGELTYMGSYWSSDQSEMYSFYFYQPKNSPIMMDVAVFDDSGKPKAVRTEEFTPDNLAKYNLEPAEELSNNFGSLTGKKVGYFKRPVMPGKPTLNIGHFEDRYTNGLWTGYQFEEEEDMKIEPKFWPFFTVALGGDQDGNDNYLLAKVSNWGKMLQGNRTYLSMSERVVIGGQKAEMKNGAASIFYLGVFNMATKEWESSQDIDMGSEILPGLWASHQGEDGTVHCLVGTKEGLFILQVDKNGNFLHKVKMSIPSMGNGFAECFTFNSKGNTLYVAGAYFSSNQRAGDPSVGISKIEDGKEVMYMTANNETLDNAMIAAPKVKVKFTKEKYVQMDRFEEIPGQGYLVFFSSNARYGSSNPYDYAAQFGTEGKFVASYAVNGITTEPAAFGKSGPIHLSPIVWQQNNRVYWLSRLIPPGWDKGVYFDTERTRINDNMVRVTTTTMRNDETYQMGSLAVIDMKGKSISNQIIPEEMLVGANPMRVLPNGSVMLDALDTKKVRYLNLLIEM